MEIILKLPLLVLIILSGLSLVIGDLFAKYWSIDKHNYQFIAAIICYILYGIFFLPTLLKEDLVVSALAVILVNIIGFIFIGLAIFQESLTPVQIIGLILGIISIILLETH